MRQIRHNERRHARNRPSLAGKGLGLAAIACLLVQVDSLGQTAGPAQTQPQPQPQEVRMSLIVTDRSNHAVESIRQEDIGISEEGQALKVTLLSKDERPLRYTIALDTSASFKSLLEPSINVARALIENKRPDDEIMIVKFVSSDNIETVQGFTADKSRLVDSLKQLIIEGGQSAVVDAVHVAVEATAAYQPDNSAVRRAVVLISDGEDRMSFYTQDQLVKLLREKEVQIFVIGIVTHLDKEGGFIRRAPRERAEKLLQSVAEESGGRVFLAKNGKELVDAAQEIFRNLNSQFVIGFERQPKVGEKGYRKVKVSIVQASGAEKLVAITRPGYLVGPREPIKSSKKAKEGSK